MTLEIEDGPTHAEASAPLIREAVAALAARRSGFLILGVDSLTYMQAARNPAGFIVEYQAGSLEEHFRAYQTVESETATGLLLSYFNGDGAWKSSVDWEKVRVTKPWWKRWRFA